MRGWIKSVVVLLLLLPMAAASRAQQVRSVVNGRTTLELNAAFMQTIQSYGASFTDLGMAALQNGTVTFPITSGAVDLDTVAGEVRHKSGLVITADDSQIQLLDWVLDITGSQPTISVLFVINGEEMGRFPLFLVQPPTNLALPLQPSDGVIFIKQASLFLSPAGATTFNNLFGLSGDQQLQAYTAVGNIDVYAVLAGTAIGTK